MSESSADSLFLVCDLSFGHGEHGEHGSVTAKTPPGPGLEKLACLKRQKDTGVLVISALRILTSAYVSIMIFNMKVHWSIPDRNTQCHGANS